MLHEQIRAQLAVLRSFDDGTLVALGRDAVWDSLAVSRGGVLEDVSDEFVELVRGDRDEIIGRRVVDFIVDGEQERVGDILSKEITGPYFTRLLASNGDEIPVEVRARYTDGGRIAAIRRHHGAPCPLGDQRCPLYRAVDDDDA